MAADSLMALSLARLEESRRESASRYVDMQLTWICYESGERLLTVGGVWDRREKRYTGPAKSEVRVTIQPAQLEAASWLAAWFRRYSAWLADGRDPTAWKGFERVWSALFHGGRRGGKSHLACVALATFAVMVPGSLSWAVSPTEEKTEELRAALSKLLPRSWYRYVKDRLTFTLGNHARIVQQSGFKADNLKAGGVGLALYNEGQQMTEAGFLQLRGATADAGSLVLVTANPPDKPIGRWLESFVEDVRAKRRKARTFFFDWQKNPFIERASLDDMYYETDEKTFAREILGEFVPIGDVVFHAWSDRHTIREVPAGFRDITPIFTKRTLGRAFTRIVGADFQRAPHMAGAVIKVFEKPTSLDDDPALVGIPSGVPLYWIVAETIVELSDEDGLIDALEDLGMGARTTAVIADASGDWQDADRTRGKGSWDWFRARGWRFLFTPDAVSRRNPEIDERCKVGNALLKSKRYAYRDGKLCEVPGSVRRRLFSVPANDHVNRAMRLWERKNGFPHRRSEHAHACDAVTYPLWRFEGRRRKKSKADYKSLKKFNRRSMFQGF